MLVTESHHLVAIQTLIKNGAILLADSKKEPSNYTV